MQSALLVSPPNSKCVGENQGGRVLQGSFKEAWKEAWEQDNIDLQKTNNPTLHNYKLTEVCKYTLT